MLEQAAPGLGKDALVLDHTTTSPAGTAARAARLEARGVAFLHAPIFMSPAGARNAKGIILCFGPREGFERAQPALARMSGEVVYVGERPELAAAYKLFGNALIVTMIAGLADVFGLAAAQEVAPEDALGLFQKIDVAEILQRWGRRMAQGDFTPTGTLATGCKDLRLMLEAAGAEPRAALPGLAARMDHAHRRRPRRGRPRHARHERDRHHARAARRGLSPSARDGVAHFFGAPGWASPQLPSVGGVGAQRLGPASVGHRELFAPLATTSTISIIP